MSLHNTTHEAIGRQPFQESRAYTCSPLEMPSISGVELLRGSIEPSPQKWTRAQKNRTSTSTPLLNPPFPTRFPQPAYSKCTHLQFFHSIVVSMRACHARDPGSIPGGRDRVGGIITILIFLELSQFLAFPRFTFYLWRS